MKRTGTMRRGALIALATTVGLGTLLGGAEARSRPRAPVAPPIERLVLLVADAPGLVAKPASPGLAQRAVQRALPRVPQLVAPDVAASHFARRNADLWSLAFTLKSAAAAQASTAAVVRGLRRAGLRPKRATVGQTGSLVIAKRGGTAFVVWQRRNGVGEILLAAKLAKSLLGTVSIQYAGVADAHMEHLLSQDAWQRTLGRIRADGSVPRTVALDLFALAYGPLPGTKLPPGPYGRITEGTLAAREILRIWPTLTGAQQAAAGKALGLRSVRLGKGKAWRTAHAVAAGDYGDPTFKIDPGLTKEIEQYEQIYLQKLKPAPVLKLKVVAGTSTEKSTAWADTLPVDIDGNTSNDSGFCRVRLLPIGQAEKNATFRELALAHEAFHCMQFEVMTPEGAFGPDRRDWLLEGSADWAAISIRNPIGWDVAGGNIRDYLNTPRTPLFSRVYDAVGFFGHAELVAGDLWSRMVAILKEPTSLDNYLESGGAGTTFLDSWGSSTFNASAIGFDWYSTRPIAPPPSFRPEGTVPIWADVELVDADPYALARYVIDSEYGLARDKPLLHIQIKGFARLGNTAPLDTTDLEDAWFWLGPGRPKCPPDKVGLPPRAIPLGAPRAALALTGGLFGASGTVEFVSLDRYCKEKQKPPKPPTGGPAGGGGGGGGGGGEGGGSSFADPHLVTFDGLWYDYQGAGEYTLARSPSGDLEVQAREQPFPGTSILSKVLAINTAIAMRVNGDRVGVYMPDLSVRVNGRGFVPTLKLRRLPHGGRIRLTAKSEGQIEVVWPDGSLVRVFPNEGLGVLVQPVKARQGTLEGLFGNFDANTSNDLVTRGGTRLNVDEATSSFRLLYHVFGDSWRVTRAQSLFDYVPGQSTRTFQKLGFPNLQAILKDLKAEQRRAAERYCRSLHIKRPEVFRACVLDVGATGDAAFATAAAQAERTGGGFPAPHRAGKPKKRTRPGSSKETTSWTRVAAKSSGPISLALDANKVVAAYLNGQGSAEAMTFSPSAAKDASAIRRNPITSGWATLGDPLLVQRAGGGLQVLLSGTHGGLGDPLNGVSFAIRKADGSFGAPSLAATSTYAEFIAGAGVLAPDGAPVWASDRGGTLWLWRGATAAVGADLSALTGGPAGDASVARDRAGRYWLAWNTVFASQQQRNGLYLLQFDPQSLKPIGSPVQAPTSSAVGYSGRLPLACWAICRLVYFQPSKGSLKIVSWAPGERAATTVAAARAGHVPGQVAVAYHPSGRLWVAWWDNGGNAGYGYRAVLGDARGARGTPFSVGRPTDASGGAVDVIASGNNLVLVTIAKGSAPYVNVLAPR